MYRIYLIVIVMIFFIIGCDSDKPKYIQPMAINDRFNVVEGVENKIDILANDLSEDSSIDKSSILITLQPTNGDIQIDQQSGEVFYSVTNLNQTQDIFKYKVKDLNGNTSNEAVVVLDINKALTKAKSWYIRVLAIDKTDDIKTSDSKFGELEDINASRYNLEVYNTFNQSQLSVLFQDNNKEFKALFHPYTEETQEWNFVLKSNNSNADIVLKWQGVYVLDAFMDSYGRKRYKEYRYTQNPIIYNLKLIDKKTGVELPAIQDGRIYEYSFNMNGDNIREFMWVLSDTEVNIKMLQSKSLKKEVKQVLDNKQVFKLNSPPMMDRISYEQSIKK